MAIKSFFLSVVAAILLSGCIYPGYTSPIDDPIVKPIAKTETARRFVSSLSDEGGEKTASIGDDLFAVFRYFEERKVFEHIPFRAPTSKEFPQGAIWSATYSYNDGSSGDLLVYTTPSFYSGHIGVILDDAFMVSTDKPLVQVRGAKEGRRWRLYGKGKFFRVDTEVSKDLIEKPWGLRFGGVADGFYTFEIVNREESTTTEVLQTIKVSERDFLSGFVVRDAFVRGVEPYNSGVIKFVAKERKIL